jgi:hypothetical protein
MTIIKSHFEVFLVTSKNQGNGIIESKVGLPIFNKGQITHIVYFLIKEPRPVDLGL